MRELKTEEIKAVSGGTNDPWNEERVLDTVTVTTSRTARPQDPSLGINIDPLANFGGAQLLEAQDAVPETAIGPIPLQELIDICHDSDVSDAHAATCTSGIVDLGVRLGDAENDDPINETQSNQLDCTGLAHAADVANSVLQADAVDGHIDSDIFWAAQTANSALTICVTGN